MKNIYNKMILSLVAGVITNTANAQAWYIVGAGSPAQVRSIEVYNSTLYVAGDSTIGTTGNIYRWNGASLLSIYSPYRALDLTTSSTDFYFSGAVTAQGVWYSPTANSGSFTQIGAGQGGAAQIAYFNGYLYRNSNRMVGTAWSAYPAGMSNNSEIKAVGSYLYYSGYLLNSGSYYGLGQLNTAGTFTVYGPTISVNQQVTDFDFDGSDLYVCLQGSAGTTGGFMKQNGSAWTNIMSFASGEAGKCEVYAGKVYFTKGASTSTIYVYDPSQAVSGTNPSAIATFTGYANAMEVYNNSLYIGGNFTSINTVSSGTISANNIIRLSVTFPTASFVSTPTTVCGLSTVQLYNGSMSATSYKWYINGNLYSTAFDTSVVVSAYTNPYAADSFTVTLVAYNGMVTDTATSVINTLASPNPVVTPSGSDLTTGSFSSYQWLLYNTVITSATSQTYTPTVNGNYAVIVTNANGCSDTSAVYN